MWKPITTVFTLGVLVAASFWGAAVLFSPKQEKTQSIASPQVIEQPKQAYATPKEETVTSIDGQKKLKLTETKSGTNTSYTITATNEDGTQTLSYTTTISDGSSIALPANAWSPDDKYVFIKNVVNGHPEFLSLQTNGETFANGDQTLNITKLFTAKDNGYVLTDVTGWAAPGLLITETTKDGTQGPTFWFEIPSRAFIQLSQHQ